MKDASCVTWLTYDRWPLRAPFPAISKWNNPKPHPRWLQITSGSHASCMSPRRTAGIVAMGLSTPGSQFGLQCWSLPCWQLIAFTASGPRRFLLSPGANTGRPLLLQSPPARGWGWIVKLPEGMFLWKLLCQALVLWPKAVPSWLASVTCCHLLCAKSAKSRSQVLPSIPCLGHTLMEYKVLKNDNLGFCWALATEREQSTFIGGRETVGKRKK